MTLASKRYAQLRRFAPAFLEAFEFSVPEGGKDLLGAVTLLKEKNRTGKRKLPDIVPMPFPGKHWESLILEDGRPSRRVYETAVIATLRDRLRAGDVWVEGSRDYRRFDAYLPPVDEAENVLPDSGLETDGPTWLDERRERLHHRLREMRQKLVGGHLEGVRLEGGRLKIMPYDPITPPAGETLDRAMGTNVGGPESPEPACWGGAPSPFVPQILPCQTQSICISANPHSPPTRCSQSKIRLTGRPASTECSSQGLKNPNIDPIAPCGLPSRAAELSST